MLRYAPIGESHNVSSPRIENPYMSTAYAPVHPPSSIDVHDACHAHLRTVYERQGVRGLVRLMDEDMVRDLQSSMAKPRHGLNIHLGIEEIAVLLLGALLIAIIVDS